MHEGDVYNSKTLCNFSSCISMNIHLFDRIIHFDYLNDVLNNKRADQFWSDLKKKYEQLK